MTPLYINNKSLFEIFDPDNFDATWSAEELAEQSIARMMFPTSVALTSETYSRDAERTADYELQNLLIVNRKAKPEFTWSLIRAEYVKKLLVFLGYTYNFKDSSGDVIPRESAPISVTYMDFIGMRTINAYLGQTIDGTLVDYDGTLYWENFRIAFPER